MFFVPKKVIEQYRNNPEITTKDLEGIENHYGKPASKRTARRWKHYLDEGMVEIEDEDVLVVERIKPVRPKARPVLLKAAVIDIETTSFRAEGYAGYTTMCSILPLDSDEVTNYHIHFEDKPDDRELLLEVFEALWPYDILIHQNGADFDFNFLNTRRMFHGMPTLRSWLYFDTYQTAKVLAPKIGKSLESLGYFFQSDGIKTKIGHKLATFASPYREDWDKVMNELILHCDEDVKMTRDVFNALFVEALTLGTNQFKVTKWKRGVPHYRAWEMEYSLSQDLSYLLDS